MESSTEQPTLADLKAQLDRIEQLVSGVSQPMSDGYAAFLAGGLEGIQAQNKARNAAERALRRKARK